MPKEKKPSFTLGSIDDLFTTQEMRDDAKLARIYEIPIEEIDEFPDHPYKVKDDEDMMNLVESIRENGVLTPATVRKKEDGRYEMLSGHRRMRACELLGMETLRCDVVELDKDAATILMCDSNLQRSTILPSEKAFAYKMRLDAMKRQGKRVDLTSDPVGPKLMGSRSNDVLANQVNESATQIKRYIRLTELIPEILEMVDGGQIAMRPAVEISYLKPELQKALLDSMEAEACTPSHDQTLRFRNIQRRGELTPDVINEIMREEKPNQKEKIIFKSTRMLEFLPKDLPPNKREEYIIQAIVAYNRQLEQARNSWDER